MTIGVLAFQGDVSEHLSALTSIGAEALEIRSIADLEKVQGLIIPGGESTVISKFMEQTSLWERLKQYCADKQFPVYGTCAGAILLAKNILSNGQVPVHPLGLMDITVERNAYGRQAESFVTEIQCAIGAKKVLLRGAFIRAPIIREVGPAVEILGTCRGNPVFCQQGNMIATTFHPELLESSLQIHRYFLSLI